MLTWFALSNRPKWCFKPVIWMALLAIFAWRLPAQSGGLAPQQAYCNGYYYYSLSSGSIASGDFNHDGKADVAVAGFSCNTVTILLGNANGSFTRSPGSPIFVGNQPVAVAVGDFNHDGKQDLAVVNNGDNTVSVLLGDGSGGFTPATGSPYQTDYYPTAIVVGDFNGDNKQDLATSNGNGTVTVLLGDGTGAFTQPSGSPFQAGTGPVSLAIGDFNGDSKQDIAVLNQYSYNQMNQYVNQGKVTVLLGNGSGGFSQSPSSPIAVGTSPGSIAAADFNGDNKSDLAVVNNGDSTLTVLLANSSGGFSPATGSPFSVGSYPVAVVTTDFNGDHKPDLAVANTGNYTIAVLIGNGSGGFTPATGSPFASGDQPSTLVAGDVNGDSRQDVILATAYDGGVRALLGDGSGGLLPGGQPVTLQTIAVATGNFSDDNNLDLAELNAGQNSVSVLLNDGMGNFSQEAGSPYPVGNNPVALAVGDFNGDSKPDLAVVNQGDNSVTI